MAKGYARVALRGEQAPFGDPATRSPVRGDGLPKGCWTQKIGRAKRAKKFEALLKKIENIWFFLRKDVSVEDFSPPHPRLVPIFPTKVFPVNPKTVLNASLCKRKPSTLLIVISEWAYNAVICTEHSLCMLCNVSSALHLLTFVPFTNWEYCFLPTKNVLEVMGVCF